MPETLKTILTVWLILANVVALILMFIDKVKARNGAWRISEFMLFLFPILGGAIGGVAGMWLFRHKTKHWYFVVFFHLLAILQIAAIIWVKVKM